MITSTRTHVTYFTKADVEVLEAEISRLSIDLAQRAAHMPLDAYLDAADRIGAVQLAVKRLSDRVPE